MARDPDEWSGHIHTYREYVSAGRRRLRCACGHDVDPGDREAVYPKLFGLMEDEKCKTATHG